MQCFHIRYRGEQISTPSCEECGSQVEDLEASWRDQGFGYDRSIYNITERLYEAFWI